MADTYSWSASRGGGTYRLPGPDRLGWWAAVAMFLSILLHVVVFFMLDRWVIVFTASEPEEIVTRPINISQPEVSRVPDDRVAPPEDVVIPPNDASALLEEVEILAILPEDQEIDMAPAIIEPEYAAHIENPTLEGSPQAIAEEIMTGFDIEQDLPELGRQPESIKPAAIGQLTVDPGAVDVDDAGLGSFADDVIRRGANGKAANGTLDGIDSLDNLLGLPPNVLIGKKTMLPSDLLFEFNSSVLRESAKVGLMKLGLLMDRNPNLYCWIEGHTDLVGGDEFNLKLSIERAEAVKTYLVNSMKMDGSKIYTRGFGRYEPIIISGTQEEQGVNRRVEIRMRKTPPTKDQLKIEPKKAEVIDEAPPQKAIIVKPNRVPTMQEQIDAAPPARVVEEPKAPPAQVVEEAPRAQPVPPPPAQPLPLKAEPVEEQAPPLRAEPAFPEIPRATPVE